MTDSAADMSAIVLATELTIAWLGNPNSRVSAEDVPAFIQKMHATVTALAGAPSAETQPVAESEFVPAVTVRKSLASKEHIISLIDGKPYRTLRRHLSSNGLTPTEYRARYNLRADYPMVAEAYSQARSEMAKRIGLGRKAGYRKPPPPEGADVTPAPKAPRGRPKKNA